MRRAVGSAGTLVPVALFWKRTKHARTACMAARHAPMLCKMHLGSHGMKRWRRRLGKSLPDLGLTWVGPCLPWSWTKERSKYRDALRCSTSTAFIPLDIGSRASQTVKQLFVSASKPRLLLVMSPTFQPKDKEPWKRGVLTGILGDTLEWAMAGLPTACSTLVHSAVSRQIRSSTTVFASHKLELMSIIIRTIYRCKRSKTLSAARSDRT